MEAAITAAQRGMKVTVYEKGELGGKFKALSTPPEKIHLRCSIVI